jgi:bacillithiol biosynthesis deacetylase BshB1
VLGLSVRDNLGMADCFFEHNEDSLKKIIQKIREYRPTIVLANSFSDRHPDHARASKLISDACFYSGLRKIDTGQEAWRPKAVYHYNQDFYNKPDFVVDVTEYWEKKEEALRCYASQFYDPNSKEPATPIAGKEFFDFLRARSMDFGRPSGYLYAEGFMVERTMGVRDLFDLD